MKKSVLFILKCNFFQWYQSWIFSLITPLPYEAKRQ